MTASLGNDLSSLPSLVAVIMPAYNSQDTIVRAIESVRAQTLPDWTLTIVDDGSTDATSAVVNEYIRRHRLTNVQLITLTTNVGVAEARNVGISKSSSTWISFVDADDEMVPTHLSTMIGEVGAHTEVDIVLCGRTVVLSTGRETHQHSKKLGVFAGAVAARLTLSDQLTPFPWDRLIRRTLFNGTGFPKGAARCEDSMTNVVLCSRARRVVSIAESGVRYYVSGGSITWGRIYTLDDTRIAWNYMKSSISTEMKSGMFGLALNNARATVALTIAQTAMTRDGANIPSERRTQISSVVDECREHIRLRDILSGFVVNPTTGMAAALLKVMPALYRLLYRRYVAATYEVAG